jgi:mono/diheme cytochrome c family protein
MRRILTRLVVLGLICLVAGLYFTRPKTLPADALAGLTPDLANGEQVFWAGGCASCHADPKATGEAQLVLQGGQRLASPFGNFVVPNISPSEQGIAGWTTLDLANAMHYGTSPKGKHYFPAFPYGSYVKATMQDIVDLKSYLDTLPLSDRASEPHEVGFPFNIRLSLGGWKMLFFSDAFVVTAELSPEETRGRYLAEALGHCGECHTPRNALGGWNRAAWLGGAANPSGTGRIPNITPGKLTWSNEELVEYFTSGFTPEFDSAGGHMAYVVENLSKLPESDRASIATYLKKVASVE